jgi:DNA-binding MarR family transcriptional regulator
VSEELYEKLSRFQWLLHKHQLHLFHEGGPTADQTRGQGRILAVLRMKDGLSTKELSYLLGLRVSSLNETLAKLEKNGYVTREPSEADKRIILICLTEKGKSENLLETPDLSDIFAVLNAEEQAVFAQYLDRILEVMETRFGIYDGDEGNLERLRAAYDKLNSRFGGTIEDLHHRGLHGFRHLRDFRGLGNRRDVRDYYGRR